MADQRIVGAEENLLCSNQPRHFGKDLGLVQEGRRRRVEVNILQYLRHFGHQRVEGQAAAPMSADDGVLREILDEAAEFF